MSHRVISSAALTICLPPAGWTSSAFVDPTLPQGSPLSRRAINQRFSVELPAIEPASCRGVLAPRDSLCEAAHTAKLAAEVPGIEPACLPGDLPSAGISFRLGPGQSRSLLRFRSRGQPAEPLRERLWRPRRPGNRQPRIRGEGSGELSQTVTSTDQVPRWRSGDLSRGGRSHACNGSHVLPQPSRRRCGRT